MKTLNLKHVISANILLGILYVISSYYLWAEVKNWSKWNIASVWSPILIMPHRIPNTPQVQMAIGPAWNLPFILFWVMLAVNLYFYLSHKANKLNSI
jgi:hypothetical protein